MSTMSLPQRQFTITGRKVLLMMVAFFGVIFAVNGVFLYFAIDSWPGLTSDKAYVEGLQYNQVLESAERQAAVGWTSSLAVETRDGGSAIRVTMTDASGDMLSGLKPMLSILRPVGQPDPILVAAHEVHPGVYETLMPTLEAGRWSIAVQVGDEYLLNHDIWLKP